VRASLYVRQHHVWEEESLEHSQYIAVDCDVRSFTHSLGGLRGRDSRRRQGRSGQEDKSGETHSD
jgi:hypothetical protein